MPHSQPLVTALVAATAAIVLALSPTASSAHTTPTAAPAGMHLVNGDSAETMGAPFKTYKMKNKKKVSSNYVNKGQVLAKCQSSGGHCAIDSTKSATRTIGLSLGASRKWAASQLSISSAKSTSLSITCTSPRLKKNQTWKAYPLGTRWSYKIQSQLYGSDNYGRSWPVGKPTTSGTRYAFNPTGISCRL